MTNTTTLTFSQIPERFRGFKDPLPRNKVRSYTKIRVFPQPV
jgi:hypothetical protein